MARPAGNGPTVYVPAPLPQQMLTLGPIMVNVVADNALRINARAKELAPVGYPSEWKQRRREGGQLVRSIHVVGVPVLTSNGAKARVSAGVKWAMVAHQGHDSINTSGLMQFTTRQHKYVATDHVRAVGGRQFFIQAMVEANIVTLKFRIVNNKQPVIAPQSYSLGRRSLPVYNAGPVN